MSDHHYSESKDINRMVRELLLEGWTLKQSGKHPKLTSPGGEGFVTFAMSPSDVNAHRQFARAVKRLKRAIHQKQQEFSTC